MDGYVAGVTALLMILCWYLDKIKGEKLFQILYSWQKSQSSISQSSLESKYNGCKIRDGVYFWVLFYTLETYTDRFLQVNSSVIKQMYQI